MSIAPGLHLVEEEPASPAEEAEGPPAVICFPFAGGIAGGSHISTVKLIQSLDRSHFTPLILLHHDRGEVAELLRAEGLDYLPAPSPHHFGDAPGVSQLGGIAGSIAALAVQPRLAAFLRRNRVRIVHTNEGPMHVSWAIPSLLGGAKLLWHHRSSPEARGLRHLAPLFAAKVVSVSRYAVSLAEGRFAEGNVAVVYSPFDTDGPAIDRREAHAALVAELGVDPATRFIGYFGNFTLRKRPLLFVDAIAEAVRGAPDLPIMGLMFGATILDGMDRAVKDRAREQGVGGRIRLMGFRYPAAPWLAACDAHVVTALGEPFGRSLIEAMLLGTPVVAVASGGNIEAIRDEETGLLAAPDDARSVAGRIVELLRRPDWAAHLAATAKVDALLRFGRERHGRAMAAIYRELLET